jgi:murein DD-endopeptidase MepM/ murein hydrolase activator NlpD
VPYTREREKERVVPPGDSPDDQPERDYSQYTTTSMSLKVRSAAEEARDLLDELAGYEMVQERPARTTRRDPAARMRGWLGLPFAALSRSLNFLTRLTKKADFRLAQEMRQFLKHPGHFFWFNRVAPQQAAQYFGTSSTDVMTNHARRYGAHMAVLLLAVLVVAFGGFSGITRQLISPDLYVNNPQQISGNLVLNGDGREIYVSSVLADNAAFTRRIETQIARQGDTYAKIAAERNVSLDTILYANNIIDADTPLEPGQKVIVPPVTGMLHIVNPGDTIAKIADMYGVDPRTIQSYGFNRLQSTDPNTALKALQEVVVPGGSRPPRTQLYLYKARPGDTVKSIAQKFGITTETLTENNDLENGLKVGTELRILPVDGVIYTVKRNDTLDGIAKYLSTSPENIIGYRPNNVTRGVRMETGKSLIVPGGVWPPPPPPEPPKPPAPAPAPRAAATPKPQPAAPGQAVRKPAPRPSTSQPSQPSRSGWASNAGVATGRMVWPVPSRGVITTYFGQYIWYGVHKGLDIASGCGNRIIAADGGVVVESGWSPHGYGLTMVIDHGNGIKTRYAHFSSMSAWSGQRVAKGQVIGYEGTTGNSTGCHLHFEVIVGGQFRNPLAYM